MSKVSITPEAVERLAKLLDADADAQNSQPCEMTGLLPDDERDAAATLRAQAERIKELEKETRELALDCLTAHGQADDALCDAKKARNDALREAAAACDKERKEAVKCKLPQLAMGALYCKREVLALIEGDTND